MPCRPKRSLARHTLSLLLALVYLVYPAFLASCANEKPATRPPTLSDPSKADDGGQEIVPLGPIAYGGEERGEFVVDDQFEAYTFRAAADSVITLDNSHLGSSAALDSTLFIYGPRNADGFYGADARAFDDDSGWGLHARIRDFVVPESGEYLAVLSTYARLDRGRYRLTLTCESGDCEPPPAGGPIVREVTDLMVAEDGESRVFQVHLTSEPTQPVEISIDSNNFDEALVYPTRIFFCPVGTYQNNVGCVSDRGDPLFADATQWQRTVEVRVTGVRDGLDDGDAAFDLNFRVESADPQFANIDLSPLQGINADVAVPIDYADLDELTDEALLQGLYAHIGDHQVFGYQGVNSARTLLFGSIDVHGGKVESLYDGSLIDAPGGSILAYMRGFNTEHSWPQAQFDRLDPMVSDLHHIYPTDIESNGLRSSYGFGYNSRPDSVSGLGPSATDGRAAVYQVRAERRGDIARAHFYMVARYAFDESIGITFDDDGAPENGRMDDAEEAVLRAWHLEDPVDDLERGRNERVAALQGNRNPFIDRPELVERIANF